MQYKSFSLEVRNQIVFQYEYFTAGLQATTIKLDFRVTALEENGGNDGNSSLAELEVRVETLEGTATDHETRISSTESDISGTVFLFVPWVLNLQACWYLHGKPL